MFGGDLAKEEDVAKVISSYMILSEIKTQIR